MARLFKNSGKDLGTGYSKYLKGAYLDTSGNNIHIKGIIYFKIIFHVKDVC